MNINERIEDEAAQPLVEPGRLAKGISTSRGAANDQRINSCYELRIRVSADRQAPVAA